MTDFPTALFHILHGPARPPLALCLYTVADDRRRHLETIESLMPVGEGYVKTFDVEAIFRELATVLLVVPADEPAALQELAGRREALLDRTAPAILFVQRNGSASDHLSDPEQAGLLSWLRSSILDPKRYLEIDGIAEDARFIERTGHAPADFVREFRIGSIPDTLDNSLFYSDALLLARSDSPEATPSQPDEPLAAPTKTHPL